MNSAKNLVTLMADNIRTIVRKHQEEQALKNYLGSSFETTSPEDKRKFINAVISTIDREVELILNSFVEEIQSGSSVKKRRKNLTIVVVLLTSILTTGIGYCVNIENWIMVGLLSVALGIVQVYSIFSE